MPTYYIHATEKVVTTYTVDAGFPQEALELFEAHKAERSDGAPARKMLNVRVGIDYYAEPILEKEY